MCHLPGIRSAVTDFRTARSFGGNTQQWLDLRIAHDLKSGEHQPQSALMLRLNAGLGALFTKSFSPMCWKPSIMGQTCHVTIRFTNIPLRIFGNSATGALPGDNETETPHQY